MATTKIALLGATLLLSATALAACSSSSDTEETTDTTTAEAASDQYQSCAEAQEAGDTPLTSDNPRYNEKLDRDGDGTACDGGSTKAEEKESATENWGTALQASMLATYGIESWDQITDRYPGDAKGHILDMHSEGDSLTVVTNLDKDAGKELGEDIATQMANHLKIGKETNDLPGGADKATTVNVMSLSGDLIAHKSVD